MTAIFLQGKKIIDNHLSVSKVEEVTQLRMEVMELRTDNTKLRTEVTEVRTENTELKTKINDLHPDNKVNIHTLVSTSGQLKAQFNDKYFIKEPFAPHARHFHTS